MKVIIKKPKPKTFYNKNKPIFTRINLYTTHLLRHYTKITLFLYKPCFEKIIF